MAKKTDLENVVREIKCKTRSKYSSGEKNRIEFDGHSGDESIVEDRREVA